MDAPLMTMRSPAEVGLALAHRVRALRLLKDWTRVTLARRSGVTAASIKRFERTGKVSLESLLALAHALARLDELDRLFLPPPARSMAELERAAARPARSRGRR